MPPVGPLIALDTTRPIVCAPLLTAKACGRPLPVAPQWHGQARRLTTLRTVHPPLLHQRAWPQPEQADSGPQVDLWQSRLIWATRPKQTYDTGSTLHVRLPYLVTADLRGCHDRTTIAAMGTDLHGHADGTAGSFAE